MRCGRLLLGHRDIDALLSGLRRIAVLGIKPEERATQPAHMIPAYLHRNGFDLIPVPVRYPDCREILGKPVCRTLREATTQAGGRLDLVNVFRKPEDLMPHLDDILVAAPRAVWLQTGIRHEGFADAVRSAGIDVVQDECLMVEHRRWRSGQ